MLLIVSRFAIFLIVNVIFAFLVQRFVNELPKSKVPTLIIHASFIQINVFFHSQKMKQPKSSKKQKNGPSSRRPPSDHQPPYEPYQPEPYQPEPFQPHLYPSPNKASRYPDVVSHPGKFDDSSDEIIVSPAMRYDPAQFRPRWFIQFDECVYSNSGTAHPAGIYHLPFPPRIIESHEVMRAAVNRPLCRLALGGRVKVTNPSNIHIHHQTRTGWVIDAPRRLDSDTSRVIRTITNQMSATKGRLPITLTTPIEKWLTSALRSITKVYKYFSTFFFIPVVLPFLFGGKKIEDASQRRATSHGSPFRTMWNRLRVWDLLRPYDANRLIDFPTTRINWKTNVLGLTSARKTCRHLPTNSISFTTAGSSIKLSKLLMIY